MRRPPRTTEAWRNLSKQSERQLGAFVALYTLENKRSPNLLTESWRKFRNDVIHQGRIPLPNEAEEYGCVVFDLIAQDLRLLKRNRPNGITAEVHRHLDSVRKGAGEQPLRTFLSIATMIDLNGIEHATFTEAFESLRRTRHILYS